MFLVGNIYRCTGTERHLWSEDPALLTSRRLDTITIGECMMILGVKTSGVTACTLKILGPRCVGYFNIYNAYFSLWQAVT